jgi:thiamine biosynthesis lipoprotein ApbE
MDIDELVMAAYTLHQVQATGATTHPTQIPGVRLTVVTFPDDAQADTFATACMADGVPALRCGQVDNEPAVTVMHR